MDSLEMTHMGNSQAWVVFSVLKGFRGSHSGGLKRRLKMPPCLSAGAPGSMLARQGCELLGSISIHSPRECEQVKGPCLGIRNQGSQRIHSANLSFSLVVQGTCGTAAYRPGERVGEAGRVDRVLLTYWPQQISIA